MILKQVLWIAKSLNLRIKRPDLPIRVHKRPIVVLEERVAFYSLEVYEKQVVT